MHPDFGSTNHNQPPANRLLHESSPYLQQHAYNPVDWYPWGEEALSRARTEDKPIFLSIGYSACHWCHVMEQESFEDPSIAAVMNEHFISIKVDREERPDLDQIYMAAVQLITRRGGWPMSVFLTPDGKPFYGGTYWPPTSRQGMRGFRDILLQMHDIWVNRRPEVDESSLSLVEAIGRFTVPQFEQSDLNESLLKNAEQAMLSALDRVNGGFGGAPKFPHPMDLRVLLRTWKRFGNQAALDAVVLTLEKMAGGGIYDHLGGGFHRYSTDAHWLVPHFEKMLYDNALLVPVYLEAYQATGREDFARIARETLDYVLREMTSPEGGFYSTQDADSEGIEGKFFVWTPEEINEVLGAEDGKLFCASYDVSPQGNWEGHSILNRPRPLAEIAKEQRVPIEVFSAILEHSKQLLRERRSTRVSPGRDEKILTAWNGLMISAFARGAQVLREPRYLIAAQDAAKFILTAMRDRSSAEARLFHSYKDGTAKFNAYLDDYACLIDGLIDLYQADFDAHWLSEARLLELFMRQHFADPNDNIYFYTSDDHEALINRTKEVQDNATPAAHSCAAMAALRLAAITGVSSDTSGWEALKAVSGLIADHPRGAAQALIALDFAIGPTPGIVLIEGGQPDKADQLLSTFHRRFVPNCSLVRLSQTSAAGPALMAVTEGKPAASELSLYVCHQGTCEAPAIGYESASMAIRLV
ncbi:MAG: thioredoxin domain-containing protein [Planctomycetota bacterium]|nr:MAG: thioredoxin domain-containing protein [Planctomycetota bacterium]